MKGATPFQSLGITLIEISIHAPMKGATSAIPLACHSYFDFNPRTHEGCDVYDLLQAYCDDGFQSTHP